MGTDPRTSVINRYLQSWDASNLFVMGGAAFPQNPGYPHRPARRPRLLVRRSDHNALHQIARALDAGVTYFARV
jgi:hypothetical protein